MRTRILIHAGACAVILALATSPAAQGHGVNESVEPLDAGGFTPMGSPFVKKVPPFGDLSDAIWEGPTTRKPRLSALAAVPTDVMGSATVRFETPIAAVTDAIASGVGEAGGAIDPLGRGAATVPGPGALPLIALVALRRRRRDGPRRRRAS